jgi:TonB family protein
MKLKFITLLTFIMFFCFMANAQSGRKSNQPNVPQTQIEEKEADKGDEKRDEIQPVKIFRRPAPDASVAARCFRNEGFDYVKIVLRVTFDATAKITDVEVKAASGCKEFDEESIDAARRIKFEPAVQNGKPIAVTKTVIYEGGIL